MEKKSVSQRAVFPVLVLLGVMIVSINMYKDPNANVQEDQYLYMDLEDGRVNSIRMVDKETAENSKFVIYGDYVRWKQVAKKELDAVKAMTDGSIIYNPRLVMASEEVLDVYRKAL